ncbi:hypothetical protein HYH03_008113 [Edaphochlamys debaryana]|uniref:Uncharacterized protein n=1 Tax=Edaphochlamys debaryana TaxID=47281 RepID=A0A835Y6Z7_9CHLO|nr:hypothetical protein HYH03_008113 [Edaphochlamys debaryana]|eukprot:KAG2493595.1 hypothetical protein HYH03_008113 [Edaphochlamys debaryana]
MKRSVVGALGLGGYASDDDEENGSQEPEEHAQEQSQDGEPGILLPHYHSRPSLDLDAEEGFDAAALGERRQSPGAAETSGGSPRSDGDRGPDSAGAAAGGGGEPADPLSRLPPELRGPLPTACSEALQRKFDGFLHSLRTKGLSLTDQVSHKHAFRNPDFLQKLVDHFHITQHGSAFPPEIFDPTTLPDEDRIEQLLRALEREQERRARLREQQAAAGTARIDFTRAAGAGAGALGGMHASSSASNLALQQAAAAAAAQVALARVLGAKR